MVPSTKYYETKKNQTNETFTVNIKTWAGGERLSKKQEAKDNDKDNDYVIATLVKVSYNQIIQSCFKLFKIPEPP